MLLDVDATCQLAPWLDDNQSQVWGPQWWLPATTLSLRFTFPLLSPEADTWAAGNILIHTRSCLWLDRFSRTNSYKQNYKVKDCGSFWDRLPNCPPEGSTNQQHERPSLPVVRAVNACLLALKEFPRAVHLTVWNQLGAFYLDFFFLWEICAFLHLVVFGSKEHLFSQIALKRQANEIYW